MDWLSCQTQAPPAFNWAERAKGHLDPALPPEISHMTVWSPITPERKLDDDTEEQIIGLLREADAGLPVKEMCRKHGFSEPSYYAWKAKFGGMNVSDAQRLKALEAENNKLKKLLANSMLEIDAMREVLKGK